MSHRYLFPGNSIRITSLMDNDDEIYTSQVQDIIDDSTIKISTPIKSRRIIPLHADQKYVFDFYGSTALYRCTGVVIDRNVENNNYYLHIKIVSEFKKVQRRNFFRVDCLLPFYYEVLFNNQEGEDSLKQTSMITDISGGGIKFSSSHKLNENTMIKCCIELILDKKVISEEVVANVLASEVSEKSAYSYCNRAEFIDINKSHRDKIIKFVFQQQIKQKV